MDRFYPNFARKNQFNSHFLRPEMKAIGLRELSIDMKSINVTSVRLLLLFGMITLLVFCCGISELKAEPLVRPSSSEQLALNISLDTATSQLVFTATNRTSDVVVLYPIGAGDNYFTLVTKNGKELRKTYFARMSFRSRINLNPDQDITFHATFQRLLGLYGVDAGDVSLIRWKVLDQVKDFPVSALTNDVTITASIVLGASVPTIGFIVHNNSNHDIDVWPVSEIIVKTPSGKELNSRNFETLDQGLLTLKPSATYVEKRELAELTQFMGLKEPGVYHVYMPFGELRSNEIAFSLPGNASQAQPAAVNADNDSPLEIAVLDKAPLKLALLGDGSQIKSTALDLSDSKLLVIGKDKQFTRSVAITKSPITATMDTLFSTPQTANPGLYTVYWKAGMYTSPPLFVYREKAAMRLERAKPNPAAERKRPGR